MTIIIVTTAQDGTDPRWLDQIGQVANWKHTKTSPGGPSSASFDFIAPPDLDTRALDGGRLLTARTGCSIAFGGRLEQPEPGAPWSCTVTGTAALAKDHPAYNTAGTAAGAYNLNATIDYAISDGLPWTRSVSLTSPVGSAANYAGSVDDALGALVTQGGYWNLDDTGAITTPAAPPAASLLLFANSMPSRTLTGYPTAVAITYMSGSTTSFTTVYAAGPLLAKYGKIYIDFDVTSAGSISLATAQAAGQAILAKYALTGLPWTDGFTVLPGQLYTMGGVPITDLATIDANITIRVMQLGSPGNDSATQAIDVPIGQIDYDDTAGTLTLSPLALSQDSIFATFARAHHLKLTA